MNWEWPGYGYIRGYNFLVSQTRGWLVTTSSDLIARLHAGRWGFLALFPAFISALPCMASLHVGRWGFLALFPAFIIVW